MLLPDCPLLSAGAVASALIAAVRLPMDLGSLTIVVTASAGVAALDATSPDAVLRHADVALYEAKAAGRAQVRTYRPDAESFARSRRDLIQQIHGLREHNEMLVTQTRTDPLTGLPNRRAFDEALAALDAAARRAGRSYAVVYLDIDFFHSVNRAFDDAVGDAALRAIGQALTSACRAGDVVYRKGGEELVALLPDADLDAARSTGERLGSVVRELGLPSGRPERPVVTISSGVAALDLGRHTTPPSVVGEANQAMLLAKNTGRDRILCLPTRPGP